METEDWKKYKRKSYVLARPYIFGESLMGISVSDFDIQEGYLLDGGGMICSNPDNSKDQWFVNMDYFTKHYEEDKND